jgi:hypothetical protein
MTKVIIHYWGTELIELSGEGSPCGDFNEDSFVSTREQDVTCEECQQMLAEMQATNNKDMH